MIIVEREKIFKKKDNPISSIKIPLDKVSEHRMKMNKS